MSQEQSPEIQDEAAGPVETATYQPVEMKVTVLQLDPRTHHVKKVSIIALKNWDLAINEISKACAQRLGFKVVSDEGEPIVSIRMDWKPAEMVTHTRADVEFQIREELSHDIILGAEECNAWQKMRSPGVYFGKLMKSLQEPLSEPLPDLQTFPVHCACTCSHFGLKGCDRATLSSERMPMS